MTSFRRFVGGLGALTLLLASVPSVSADPVTASTSGNNDGDNITVHSNGSITFANGSTSSMATSAESFTSTINPGFGTIPANTGYQSFCVDLSQYTGGTVQADISLFGGSSADQQGNSRNIGAAGWVVNTFQLQGAANLASLAGTTLTNSQFVAAMQVAVWKEAYDAGSTNITTSGGGSNKLWFTGLNSHSLTAAQYIVNQYASSGSAQAAYFLKFPVPNTNHGTSQDQISAVPVPEPSALAIAGLGALGFLGYGLKRRKSS